ncbi:MAG: Uma2 family endonuclease [Methylovulum sp.]|uniref:Uma2 family endonuclease n=1 Tax=Methylovulum sp. TaxID=1916980 RepID=UPI002635F3F8|nr:Uma2 family endonuclease [Methylovulum sp.]MDD2725118.1 Uma2 family endonuclease [Methylovulum sp.]MDD5125844.1 Uma2 family endonuclease [Methylovulum sp.]
MSANLQIKTFWMSEDEYLEGELISETKHEYIDGEVFAMAGASRNHERIAGNIYRHLGNHLQGKPCEPFSSDLKVKVGSKFFYPDAMVVCDEPNPHSYYSQSPTLIVEVLSKSSRRMDETTKRLAYQSIPSLQEYVLIEQDFVDVEVCRLSQGWVSEHYFWGDSVCFESVGLTLTVAEIYDRVDNEEVLGLLQQE